MSSIILKDVCLDYIIKTGSDSIKKTAINLCNTLLLKKKAHQQPSIANTSYRALKNITLNFEKGDRIGLMGRNGAGKSTLLRVLAKIYKPNIGVIKINGKVSSLLDINLGMNIEATGYENIINLSILKGYSKKQAYDIIDDVENFTELGDFLAKPVRTYSTGMNMKLAFAVATALPPEILLIDEIIGAGDAQFMHKAFKRLEHIIDKSHILVLTSHSEDIIRKFCNKGVILNNGNIKYTGDINSSVNFYQSTILQQT